MTRLQKYLADCGVASRRASEELILAGRVRVNGAVAQLGCSIDPGVDEVLLDGQTVAPDETKVYIVLNKPSHTVTTSKDTHGRRTVLECVQGTKARVFPVGRLDMDVEGALLLTNDGELAHRLLHPRYRVDKVYLAQVRGAMTPETISKLERGVKLEDGLTAPAKVAVLNSGPHATRVRLVLREGRKREVKRMLTAVGHPVKRLERVSFAGISAQGLRPGEWRYLTPCEITSLRATVQLLDEDL